MQKLKKEWLRLWILDDKKFPTGYANGGFEKHLKVKAVPWRATYGHYGSLPQRCSPGGKILFLQMEDYWEFGSTKARWTDLGSKRKRHLDL